MPRNTGGTYSLPAGNPVTSGTVITSTWGNTTMADLKTEMTGSLSRYGYGGMLAPLELSSGTASSPSLTFGSDPASGMYLGAASDVRLAIASTLIQTWTLGTTSFSNAMTVAKGVTVVQSTADTAAMTATGNGTGQGVTATGGATSGAGVRGVGGSPNGQGFSGQGTGSGQGGAFIGGATGTGVQGTGGSTSGVGGVFAAAAGNSAGITAAAAGDGDGVTATSPTGRGVRGTGYYGGVFVGTGGQGVLSTGAAGAEGFQGNGGTNAPGVVGLGNGTGHGGSFTGGATGSGVLGTGGASGAPGGQFSGGAAGGAGVSATGVGSAPGVTGLGGSTGPGVSAVAGTAATSGTRTVAVEVLNGDITMLGVAAPAYNTAITNRLTPANIVKATARFHTNQTAGQPNIIGGFNLSSVSTSATDVTITWASAFATATEYACTVTTKHNFSNQGVPVILDQTTTTLVVGYLRTDGANIGDLANLTTVAVEFHVICVGAQ